MSFSQTPTAKKNKLLLIKNAILEENGSFKSKNILIRQGKFLAFLKPNYVANADEIYDAQGKICLPGIVDIHTHFSLKLSKGLYNSDDFQYGTRAAISSGITTIVDFTDQGPGEPFLPALKKRIAQAKGSYCDYSFHCIIASFSKMKNFERQVESAVRSGLVSFKIFTTYSKRGLKLSFQEIEKILAAAKKTSAYVFVHAEKEEEIEKNSLKLLTLKKRFPMKAFNRIRSEETEVSAVKEIIEINKKIKAKLCFAHISSPLSAAEIKKASKIMPVRGETCPQYLVLSDKVYSKKDAYLYSFCPPLRANNACRFLWEALRDRALSIVSTDSCGFSVKMKKKWHGDLDKLYMGVSSSQFMFSLLYTFGVKKGRISLGRLKEICCENPSVLAGLSAKGFLKEGYDADFFLFDPNGSLKVVKNILLNNCDYSVYEGLKLKGKIKTVFLRGRLAYENGVFYAPGGKYIKRSSPSFSIK